MSATRIDTHVHTNFSVCSHLPVDFLAERARALNLRVLTCTDHGNLRAIKRLRKELPDALLIPAVEVEADEGDFLVYSEDPDYLLSLKTFRGSVQRIRRDADTALVWAHPCVSQREDLSCVPRNGLVSGGLAEKELDLVARHVDGLEYFNGTMLSLAVCGLVRPLYFTNLLHLAQRYNLARMGGSDAHEEDSWFKVWTEFADPVETVRDFIRAIKEKQTRPNYDRAYFQTDVGI